MTGGSILTTNSKSICPHGGQVLLSTSNTKVLVDNVPALIESDIHIVTACPFTVGSKYSPCVKVEWSLGSLKTNANKVSLLLKTSIGKCKNAEDVPQGIAIIVNTQLKTEAQ